METPESVIRAFIVDNFLFGQSTEFSDSESFVERGLIDSMGILTLVEYVKEKYSIPVADEEIIPENWDSVSQIADFVRAKVAAAV